MRMIIMIVAALLVLGGGGAGAYFYFMNKAEASVSEDGEAGEDVAEAEEEHDPNAHYELVEFDPFILPIIDKDGVNQVVSLVVALQVADLHTADSVKVKEPKLKSAFLQDMYGLLNRHAAMDGGVIKISRIKKRLTKVSDKVLGEDVVHDVLLQVVQQRPI